MMTQYLVLLIIVTIGLFFGNFAKKNIIYGVKLPLPLVRNEKVKRIKRSYYMRYLTTITITALLYYAIFGASELIILYFVPAWIILSVTLFALANKQMKVVKAELKEAYSDQNSPSQKRMAVMWDERKLKRQLNVTFLPVLLVPIIGMIIFTVMYSAIPESFPMHFNMAGEATALTQKSILAVYGLPITSLVVSAMIYFVLRINLAAKRELSKLSPEEDASRLFIAKERLNWVIAIMMLSMNALFIGIAIYSFGWIPSSPLVFNAVIMALTLLPLLLLFIYMFTTGFSGDRIKGLSSDSIIQFEDDDNLWIAGMIYNNPDDPAIFVEKRFGGGYTFNYGNPLGKVLTIGFLLLVVVIIGYTIISM